MHNNNNLMSNMMMMMDENMGATKTVDWLNDTIMAMKKKGARAVTTTIICDDSDHQSVQQRENERERENEMENKKNKGEDWEWTGRGRMGRGWWRWEGRQCIGAVETGCCWWYGTNDERWIVRKGTHKEEEEDGCVVVVLLSLSNCVRNTLTTYHTYMKMSGMRLDWTLICRSLITANTVFYRYQTIIIIPIICSSDSFIHII